MTEKHLRELLLSAPVPDELETLRRNWRVMRAAYEQEERRPPRRELYVRPLVALAAVAAVLAAAVSPPGQAVGGWLRETVRDRVVGRTPSRPALVSLPAPGRLLVVSERGAWIVQEDGSKRRLGAYEDASWSPRGLFVVAARGRQLVALEPDGDERWSLSRARRIRAPRWSPSGFRIAYVAGRSLRVVAGDGSPDRRLARHVGRSAPAWRPGRAHVVAYGDRRGRVRVVNADSGKVLWRSRFRVRPIELEWSADGSRLVAAARRSLFVFDARGRVLSSPSVLATSRTVTVAAAPRGRRFAFITRNVDSGRSDVWLLGVAGGPKLFSGAGVVDDVVWSPDGRWLLVAWAGADQWLFMRTPGVRKIVAVSNISRQFDPGREGPPEFPEVSGWCCAS